ncbi:telomere repeats-binding bouquet formation protein 1-like [Pecten maximus]|uniref:telomere repeats-binding bouquet formation protein 1-like n=1 Tax=Pecten maximus TaxID=6579 RepID=UPI001457F68C|nr:telomere repeats-binding bouquet formation protein 1-like [Pecten maximus]
MLMNSRTFNLLLETSLYTCENHKAIRDCERKFIQKIRKNSKRYSKRRPLPSISTIHTALQPTKKTMSVYDFMSTESDSDGRVTPPRSTNSCKYNLAALKDVISRRSRIPYTEEEVDNIMKGVEQFGTRWNQILVTFNFHHSRTATDLKDKYKRLLASQSDIPEKNESICRQQGPKEKRQQTVFNV